MWLDPTEMGRGAGPRRDPALPWMVDQIVTFVLTLPPITVAEPE